MKKLHFPDALTLLVGCILVAALLSWVLPAGRYERRQDPATGRSVVVPGTYERVEPAPVGLFAAAVAIPRGMADAADVVFLVFLIGGAFTVVDATGALRAAVEALVRRFGHREALLIPIVALPFALGGILENMQEEIIPLIPVVLLVSRRLGFDAVTALAMSAGAAFVGSAFSPVNPFQVGIAQKLAEVPLLSGAGFRTASLVAALALWIGSTMRHAVRNRVAAGRGGAAATRDGDATACAPASGTAGASERDEGRDAVAAVSTATRPGSVLAIVGLTFAILVYGLTRLGWNFDQMSGLFFLMGIAVGVIGGLGHRGTVNAYVRGFREMSYAALLIGFARAISVVLEDGRIIDTIVHGLFAPVADLPLALSALGMMGAHALLHVPVPSVSGQAVLTMPVLVPLSDLLGMSRQVVILAYQFGAGICELLTPTNGALMAMIAAAGIRYEEWMRFATPRALALWLLGAACLLLGIAVGL